MTVSTASDPEETKNVLLRSPGAISAILCASSRLLGCWKLQLGKKPSSFICFVATSASSALPCPTWVVKSPASPSMYLRPPSSVTYDPSPETMTGNFDRSEEHTSELQSRQYLVCRLLLEKKKPNRPARPRPVPPLTSRSFLPLLPPRLLLLVSALPQPSPPHQPSYGRQSRLCPFIGLPLT